MEGTNKRARENNHFEANSGWKKLLAKLLWMILQLTPILERLVKMDEIDEENLAIYITDELFVVPSQDGTTIFSTEYMERPTPAEVRQRDQLEDVAGLHLLLGTFPCDCQLKTKAWVAYKQGKNHNKIFFRCPKDISNQYQYWSQSQPWKI